MLKLIVSPVFWGRFVSGRLLQPTYHVKNITVLQQFDVETKYRGFIFDVDNTLTSHHVPEIHSSVRAYFEKLCKTHKVVIFSNCGPRRHAELLTMLDVPLVGYGFKKPYQEGFDKAIEILGLKKEDVLMVGDRLLTDIYGANLSKIDCALVDPFDKNEPKPIRRIRRLEKLRLKCIKPKFTVI